MPSARYSLDAMSANLPATFGSNVDAKPTPSGHFDTVLPPLLYSAPSS